MNNKFDICSDMEIQMLIYTNCSEQIKQKYQLQSITCAYHLWQLMCEKQIKDKLNQIN